MSKPLWTFAGFETDAGKRVVQRWYWDDLAIDERDDIRDRISHLENLPKNLWKEPHFKWFGDIGEIRKATPKGALRIYGYFPEDQPTVFVFLRGTIKKKNNDSEGVELARDRVKRLKQNKGRSHEFKFEEEPSRENSAREGDAGKTG